MCGRGWKEDWGGHLALWEGTLEGLKQSGGEAARVAPMFNRAVLFRTSGTHTRTHPHARVLRYTHTYTQAGLASGRPRPLAPSPPRPLAPSPPRLLASSPPRPLASSTRVRAAAAAYVHSTTLQTTKAGALARRERRAPDGASSLVALLTAPLPPHLHPPSNPRRLRLRLRRAYPHPSRFWLDTCSWCDGAGLLQM